MESCYKCKGTGIYVWYNSFEGKTIKREGVCYRCEGTGKVMENSQPEVSKEKYEQRQKEHLEYMKKYKEKIKKEKELKKQKNQEEKKLKVNDIEKIHDSIDGYTLIKFEGKYLVVKGFKEKTHEWEEQKLFKNKINAQEYIINQTL